MKIAGKIAGKRSPAGGINPLFFDPRDSITMPFPHPKNVSGNVANARRGIKTYLASFAAELS
jgi:hypothetical protein